MVKRAKVQYEKLSLSSACEATLEIDNTGMITATLEVSHTTMDLMAGQLPSMTRNPKIMSNMGDSAPKCLIFRPEFNE